MPLLFNYLKIADRFISRNASFKKKLNKCREFQLTLQMIAMEINLTIIMTYLQLETRIMHYIRHLLSSPRQPTTLWPKAPDFVFYDIFLCKIICNNDFIVKFIKMYSLILKMKIQFCQF